MVLLRTSRQVLAFTLMLLTGTLAAFACSQVEREPTALLWVVISETVMFAAAANVLLTRLQLPMRSFNGMCASRCASCSGVSSSVNEAGSEACSTASTPTGKPREPQQQSSSISGASLGAVCMHWLVARTSAFSMMKIVCSRSCASRESRSRAGQTSGRILSLGRESWRTSWQIALRENRMEPMVQWQCKHNKSSWRGRKGFVASMLQLESMTRPPRAHTATPQHHSDRLFSCAYRGRCPPRPDTPTSRHAAACATVAKTDER